METYECSSRGDKRFSAFYARLEDGRSIEEHYQCDVKGYDPGGRNWRLGKGKPPLDTSQDMFTAYCRLWYRYLRIRPELAKEIKIIAETHELVDMFAGKSTVNQATAITWLIRQKHI